MFSTLEDLKARRSIRKFKDEQISEDLLEKVLEIGTYAPTALGAQCPVMVVVQDKDDIALMSRLNSKIMGREGFDPFYAAPTVIVVCIPKSAHAGVQDGSLVLGNLLNAAHAVGLGACWINRAKEVLEMPEGIELLKKWGLDESYAGVGNCIIGYPDCEMPEPKPRKEGYVIRA